MSDENDIDIYGDDIGGEVSFYIIITIIIVNDILFKSVCLQRVTIFMKV